MEIRVAGCRLTGITVLAMNQNLTDSPHHINYETLRIKWACVTGHKAT
jgi:glycine cleavage system H lipoate-binding protein